MASILTKRAGAPAGTVRLSLGGTTYIFDDSANKLVTVNDPAAAAELAKHPFIKLDSSTDEGNPNSIKFQPALSPITDGPARPRRVVVVGNSLADGGWSVAGYNRAWRFTRVACDMLGAEEYNVARDGSIVSRSSDAGGWRATLKRFKPTSWTGTTSATRKPPEALLPDVECAIVCRNLNDLIQYGPSEVQQRPFQEALRTEITRFRTAWHWNIADAEVTSTVAATQADTGGADGSWKLAAANDTFDVTLPASWPGGYVHAGVGFGSGAGGQWDFLTDGVVQKSVDLTNVINFESGQAGISTQRWYVPAESHTIRAKLTALNGATAGSINFFGAEAPSPPLVVAVGGYTLPPASVTALSPNLAQENIIAQVGMMKRIVGEFDDRVVFFDTDPVMGPQDASLLAGDLLHPTEQGHIRLGGALANVIARNYPRAWLARPQPTQRFHKLLPEDGLYYGGATPGAGVVAVSGGQASDRPMIRRDASGTVHLRGVLTQNGALAAYPGNILFTLPAGYYRPDANLTYVVPAFSAGAFTTATITVYTTGVVYMTSGPVGGGTWISLSGVKWKSVQ